MLRLLRRHQTRRHLRSLLYPAQVCRLTSQSRESPPKWPPTISNALQSYISLSHDPYVNLSIEHHLLTSSDPHSAILFFYRNHSCVVIGRNQNPWVEANLPLLKSQRSPPGSETEDDGLVKLVRRRSGGGTVFHDLGNLNWTVICPPAGFTRDKHVEMVVKALRDCGIDRARVNERYDIVLDQGVKAQQPGSVTDPDDDLHKTSYTKRDTPNLSAPASLKVSGSAYKLTRRRALHHGTLLLFKTNLAGIRQYLKSAAKPFISAKGVESVSSPVGKVDLKHEDVIPAIQHQFSRLYQEQHEKRMDAMVLSEAEAHAQPAIKKCCSEMRTPEWIYGQTPQFSFSSEPKGESDELAAEGRDLVHRFLSGVKVHMNVRHGQILEVHALFGQNAVIVQNRAEQLRKTFVNRQLWGGRSWTEVLKNANLDLESSHPQGFGEWMDDILPVMCKV